MEMEEEAAGSYGRGPWRGKTVPKDWEAGIPQFQPAWRRDLSAKRSFEIQLQLCRVADK